MALTLACSVKDFNKIKFYHRVKSFTKEYNSEIRKLYLLTHEDNILAQDFYEKVGFHHESTLENHYYDNKNEKLYSIFF